MVDEGRLASGRKGKSLVLALLTGRWRWRSLDSRMKEVPGEWNPVGCLCMFPLSTST